MVTNGCELTMANTDTLRAKLINELGLREGENPDILIYFPCTFTNVMERNSKELEDELLEKYPSTRRFYLTGCFLEKKQHPRIEYIVYPKIFDAIQHHVTHQRYERNTTPYRRNVPFVEISRGCYGACTYCSIINIKGKHKSLPREEIISRIQDLVENGFHTIKLVGDEVAGYGMDTGSSLQELISDILQVFPSLKMELGQLNPNLLKDWEEEQFSFLKDERIVGSIFLPFQSASNRILKRMGRFYTIEEYQKIYQQIAHIKGKNISTDVIVGFPGESEEDHRKNIDFLRVYDFDFAGIYHFDKEKGKTKASRMDGQIPHHIKERRVRELQKILESKVERETT